ncbi:MAG: polysaccharide biosynthesis protein [Clostridia bacterium]|nr:polysaccharide biosynthesis protein [Clostridia bacterium]
MVRRNASAPVQQSFFQGAMLLTGGLLLVKVIGALFKIPLSAVIGEEGMGYFSTAYSFYNVLFSIATAGFPVAVSRMVSESDSLGRRAEVERIRRVAVPLFFGTGLFGTVLMAVTAPVYTRLVGNPGALPAMLALSPSVLLCSVAAAYRGWHEGQRNMVPTAVSQVIEALSKLLFGLAGAFFVMQSAWLFRGAGFPAGAGGAAAAILGVTVGSALSTLFLMLYRRRQRLSGISRSQKTPVRSRRVLTGTLLRTALPMAVGAVAMSLSGLIDASFLQTRLSHILHTDPGPMLSMYTGCIPAENLMQPKTLPNYLFGCYNMALTLFMLVPSLTQAIGISALPSVTHAFARGDRTAWDRSMETVLQLTCLAALPAGMGLSALAGPIVRLIYGSRISGPILAQCLAVMGIASVFAAMNTPLGSLLQAAGHMELSVILTLAGLCVKVVLNYILVGIPAINILGGGLSTAISCLLVLLAQLIVLRKVTGFRPRFSAAFGKPVLAAGLSCLAAVSTVRILEKTAVPERFLALPAIGAAVLVYGAALWGFGSLQELQNYLEKNIKRTEKYLKNAGG